MLEAEIITRAKAICENFSAWYSLLKSGELGDKSTFDLGGEIAAFGRYCYAQGKEDGKRI